MQTFNVQLTMDASAGNAIITVTTDPRFENVLVRTELTVFGQAAAQDYLVDATTRVSDISMRAFGQTFHDQVVFGTLGEASWDPPLIINAGVITMTVANTDGDSVHFNGWVYNFAIEASKQVPLSILLAALPRASQVRP